MRVLAETDRLFITELTMDMAMDVHKNSLDEDTRRFVPDEVFETLEDARETLEFLISRYGSVDGPLVARHPSAGEYSVRTCSGEMRISDAFYRSGCLSRRSP